MDNVVSMLAEATAQACVQNVISRYCLIKRNITLAEFRKPVKGFFVCFGQAKNTSCSKSARSASCWSRQSVLLDPRDGVSISC